VTPPESPTEPRASDEAVARRAYARAGLTLAAAALAFGLFAALRPNGGPDANPVEPPRQPEPIAPEGTFEEPPLEFRWTPGGDDVDFSQLIVYRDDMNRVWASGPVEGSEVTLPVSVYEGMPAGIPCYWHVREVSAGRPRATSRIAQFEFERDLEGYGPGQNPAVSNRISD
jgi:hypothetical protein